MIENGLREESRKPFSITLIAVIVTEMLPTIAPPSRPL